MKKLFVLTLLLTTAAHATPEADYQKAVAQREAAREAIFRADGPLQKYFAATRAFDAKEASAALQKLLALWKPPGSAKDLSSAVKAVHGPHPLLKNAAAKETVRMAVERANATLARTADPDAALRAYNTTIIPSADLDQADKKLTDGLAVLPVTIGYSQKTAALAAALQAWIQQNDAANEARAKMEQSSAASIPSTAATTIWAGLLDREMELKDVRIHYEAAAKWMLPFLFDEAEAAQPQLIAAFLDAAMPRYQMIHRTLAGVAAPQEPFKQELEKAIPKGTVAAASAANAQQAMKFDDLAAIRRIGAPKVSPDGKWIAYDASTVDLAANVRKSAIYLVPSAGGDSKQITDGAKQDEGPAWSPNGKTIAYVSNRAGGAKQVYLYDVASGKSTKLTNLAGGAGSVKWVPSGNALVLVSDVYPECGVDPECTEQKDAAAEKKPTKARIADSLLFRHWNAWVEPTRAHIIFVPIGGGALRDLTPGAFNAPPFSVGGGGEFDISPDSRELVYASNTDEQPERSTNADLFIVPLAGGTAKRITTRTGADTSPAYSPDGRYIAYRSQSRAGYESDLWELWLYDRASQQSRRIAAEFPDWIESLRWSPDSKSIFVTAPRKGAEAIYEIPLDGQPSLVDASGSAAEIDISWDGKTIYFDMSTLQRPNDIYSISRSGGAPKRLTRDNDALLAKIAMGEVTDTSWTGADNTPIQGWLVKPPAFDASKKYPAVVLIHGGPQGAWSNGWSYRWNAQMFAARGYVVLLPNPRGSYGFGQKFVEEISRDWGGRAYTDIMNGVDMLAALPFVDANRIGAAGASYGGYMVNWILGHTTRFKTLVSHAGIFNLESMYGATEELWFPEFEFAGTPWDNPEHYEKWSPHRFVKNFATPTLVSHGELDFRVPYGEGLQLFTALQRKGVPSKLLFFPDEGHWVLKPQNSKLWYQTVGEWLDRWLGAR